MKKKSQLPEEDLGSKIRNKLNAPKIILHILHKHYKEDPIVKDFIETAEDEIDIAAELARQVTLTEIEKNKK